MLRLFPQYVLSVENLILFLSDCKINLSWDLYVQLNMVGRNNFFQFYFSIMKKIVDSGLLTI